MTQQSCQVRGRNVRNPKGQLHLTDVVSQESGTVVGKEHGLIASGVKGKFHRIRQRRDGSVTRGSPRNICGLVKDGEDHIGKSDTRTGSVSHNLPPVVKPHLLLVLPNGNISNSNAGFSHSDHPTVRGNL